MELPENQINVLEKKLTDLSKLLIEWKQYEDVINMSIVEMKDDTNYYFEGQEDNFNSFNEDDLSTGMETMNSNEHDQNDHNRYTKETIERDSSEEEFESEDSILESLFNAKAFEKLELEYERNKDRETDLYGEETDGKSKKRQVLFSEKFIKDVIPELHISVSGPVDNINDLESLVDNAFPLEDFGENKVITELLLLKLMELEEEQLTTKQRNKIRKMKNVVEKISTVKVYNPKLLERLVNVVN